MPSVKLQISPAESSQYLVVVSGEGFYGAPTNAKVGVRIKGDDEWFDDTLFSMRLGFPGQVLRDGGFVMSETVPGSRLTCGSPPPVAAAVPSGGCIRLRGG